MWPDAAAGAGGALLLPTNKSKAGFEGCWFLTPGRERLRPGREAPPPALEDAAAPPPKADCLLPTKEGPTEDFGMEEAREASLAAAP